MTRASVSATPIYVIVIWGPLPIRTIPLSVTPNIAIFEHLCARYRGLWTATARRFLITIGRQSSEDPASSRHVLPSVLHNLKTNQDLCARRMGKISGPVTVQSTLTIIPNKHTRLHQCVSCVCTASELVPSDQLPEKSVATLKTLYSFFPFPCFQHLAVTVSFQQDLPRD